MVFGNTLSQRSGSNRRRTGGIRVDIFPRIFFIGNTRRESVNLSNSKEGSSSCQCTMTLIGENEETYEVALRMLSELLRVLEDLREDTGRVWGLDRRRNGTEPMSTNRMENGIKLLKARCSTLPKADILYSVPAAP